MADAEPEPAALDALATYDVVADGADTPTVHALPAIPLLHEQLVTALPPLQVIDSVTVVPIATEFTEVFGDWLMLQPLGAVPVGLLLPM